MKTGLDEMIHFHLGASDVTAINSGVAFRLVASYIKESGAAANDLAR